MAVALRCVCGNRFVVEQAVPGQRVSCTQCGTALRVAANRAVAPPPDPRLMPAAVPMPPVPSETASPPPPVMEYASTPPPAATNPGEALARRGWQAAALLVLLGTAVNAITPVLNGEIATLNSIALEKAIGVIIIGGIVAFGLLRLQRWARWLMLAFAGLTAAFCLYIGQTQRPPGGSIVWYVSGPVLFAGWALLLERPTTKIKLIAGLALVIGAQVALAGVSRLPQ